MPSSTRIEVKVSEEKVVADVKEPEVKQDVKMEVDSVPYARFQEVNKKMRSLEDKLESTAKADKKRQEDLMIAEGEKDELITRLRSERDDALPYKEELETYKVARREALIGQLPEDKREKFQKVQDIETLESIVSELTQHVSPAKVSNEMPDQFGGYDSLAEFAVKDPEGYAKHRDVKSGVWNKLFTQS
jgi:hypothetical protein